MTETISRGKTDVEATKVIDIKENRDRVLLILNAWPVWPFPSGAVKMNVSLTDELKEFVRRKIENGQFRSEEAVIEAALRRLRDLESDGRKTRPRLDDFIDHEFVEYCAREADDSVTLDEVLEGTSTIKQSMARAIIEEERADRF